jgi:hypothetical protein
MRPLGELLDRSPKSHDVGGLGGPFADRDAKRVCCTHISEPILNEHRKQLHLSAPLVHAGAARGAGAWHWVVFELIVQFDAHVHVIARRRVNRHIPWCSRQRPVAQKDRLYSPFIDLSTLLRPDPTLILLV